MIRFIVVASIFQIWASNGYLVLKDISVCNKTQENIIALNLTSRIEQETITYLNGNVELKEPIGDGVTCYGSTYLKMRRRKSYVLLFKSLYQNICDTANRNVGKVWVDIAKALNLPPKQCPMPKGKYRFNNYKMDLSMMNIKGFPVGWIKEVVHVYKKNSKSDLVSCFQTILESN